MSLFPLNSATLIAKYLVDRGIIKREMALSYEACSWLDDLHKSPPGSYFKTVLLSDEYATQLRLLKFTRPDATKDELRYKLLPKIVQNIYKDWSPIKQEYLASRGYKIWSLIPDTFEDLTVEQKRVFDDNFHDYCQRDVNKQGFKTGPGDRALFGWTIEEADAGASPDDKVSWSDSDDEDEDYESVDYDDEDEGEDGEDGEDEDAEKNNGQAMENDGKQKEQF